MADKPGKKKDEKGKKRTEGRTGDARRSEASKASRDFKIDDKRKIQTGGGAYVEGDVSVTGGDFVGRDKITITEGGLSADDLAQILAAFTPIREKVAEMPEGEDKEDAAEAVDNLQKEAEKGEEASESRVKRWFQFLADTAPDAFEVAVDTFLNPIKGLSTAFKKIAQKMKEGSGAV